MNTIESNKPKQGLFAYLPSSLFGSVMGLSAMCVAWGLFVRIFGTNPTHHAFIVQKGLYYLGVSLSSIFGILAILVFIVLCIAYTLKLFTSYESVKQEFANPLTKVFFGTICISLLLLPLVLEVLLDFFIASNPAFILIFKIPAILLWILGTICMLSFSVYIASSWICQKHELQHITPAWIIPVVGLLDIPLFMPYSFMREIEIFGVLAKFCVAVGLFFAIILIPLILARIIFFAKLPDKLTPTLIILIAPFSVGFSAYSVAFGIDECAKALFCIGVFLFFVLLSQIFSAYKCCPFRVSWWAISFPLAALCISALKLTQQYSIDIFWSKITPKVIPMPSIDITHFRSVFEAFISISALLLLAFITLICIWLLIRTLKGILYGELKHLT